MDLLQIKKFVQTYKYLIIYNISFHKKIRKKQQKVINRGLSNKDMNKMKNYVNTVWQHVLIWERLFCMLLGERVMGWQIVEHY